MNSQLRSPAVVTLALLLSSFLPAAHADGICTPRTLTANEKKAYCLERGRKERDDAAMQAYAHQAQTQQAKAAANQAAIDANDAKINALTMTAQEAAVANRFAEVKSLTQQADALMQENAALMGPGESDAQAQRIEAQATRDSSASSSLSFETPTGETRTGTPYRTGAGQAFLTTYDDGKGIPVHDVSINFAGAPEHARVRVSGNPARVRGLIDAADLAAIAAFR